MIEKAFVPGQKITLIKPENSNKKAFYAPSTTKKLFTDTRNSTVGSLR